jgi:hypothetical protein
MRQSLNTGWSSDHPIRPRQHIWRYRHADLLGSLEIDHQLEFRGLLDRQIGGLGSLQDFVHEVRDAPIGGA